VDLRCLDLLEQKISKLLTALQHLDDLLQMDQRKRLVLQEFPTGPDSGVGVVTRGYEQAPRLGATHQPHQMLRDLAGADGLLVLLHLDEMQNRTQLDHAVDLLYDSLARLADQMERFLDQNPEGLEQAVHRRFEPFPALLRGQCRPEQ
jgi:hypothetical protein